MNCLVNLLTLQKYFMSTTCRLSWKSSPFSAAEKNRKINIVMWQALWELLGKAILQKCDYKIYSVLYSNPGRKSNKFCLKSRYIEGCLN